MNAGRDELAAPTGRGPLPEPSGLARGGPFDFGGAVLVVVAHSDDEVLGCGVTLASMRRVTVVHVTDGAPRDGADSARHGFASPGNYAKARRREAEAALALAGVPADHLVGLGVGDQEVAHILVATIRALAPLLRGTDVVLTHAFEGGHGDHDAVAFAVHVATRLCPDEARPRLVEMPFYYGDKTGWVRQRFLPQADAGPEWAHLIAGPGLELKRQMIAAHATQAETLRSFDLAAERFRLAPSYNFTQRPHDGPLLYERHGWNLTWPEWCARVKDAESILGLGGTA